MAGQADKLKESLTDYMKEKVIGSLFNINDMFKSKINDLLSAIEYEHVGNIGKPIYKRYNINFKIN